MAEKQRRKISLTAALKCLKGTFRKHICSTSGRNPPLDMTSTMQSRSASMPPREDTGISTSNSSSSPSVRNISAPQYHRFLYSLDKSEPEPEQEYEAEYEHNENNQEPTRETQALRIRRLASRLNPLEAFPRTQPTVGLTRRTILTSSRIPTPTEPPKGELYSQSMYRKEGRRSVLSSLGRRSMMKSRETPNSQSIKNHTRRSIAQEHVTHERSKRPSLLLRRSSVQYKDGCNNTLAEVYLPAQAPVPAHIRKERAGRNGSSSSSEVPIPRYYQTRNRLSSFQVTTPVIATDRMASPRRTRLSTGLEAPKTTQEPQPTKLPIPTQRLKPSPVKPTIQIQRTHLQTQTYNQENNAPTTYLEDLQQPAALQSYTEVIVSIPKSAWEPASKPAFEGTNSSRRKVQIEKMVPVPLPPRTPRYHVPNLTGIPPRLPYPKRRTVLMSRVITGSQIETTMPEGYWLGRFMTLTNAFHYEDSFNEPDIATGFEMPSSFSRPFQGSDDGDMAGYRVKRAFMVLENLCVTEEASASLRKFRDAYIRRFGDRWIA
ncbi:hypothetical protein BDV12DRAFT_196407 [Aspergillus spectabilis]